MHYFVYFWQPLDEVGPLGVETDDIWHNYAIVQAHSVSIWGIKDLKPDFSISKTKCLTIMPPIRQRNN